MGSFDVYDKQDNVEEKPDNSSDKQNNTDVRQDALMHILIILI